jgi:3-oxoacyl-[acyl-carrier protein] reductase
MQLQGKTALITGGSRGIGRACVRRFAAAGARVAFVYHSNKEAADALVAELASEGHQAQAIQADVADSARAQQVVGQLVDAWGQIDILVNSAGVIRDGLFAMMNPEDWQQVVGTNLGGTYNYCQAVTQPMLSAASMD